MPTASPLVAISNAKVIVISFRKMQTIKKKSLQQTALEKTNAAIIFVMPMVYSVVGRKIKIRKMSYAKATKVINAVPITSSSKRRVQRHRKTNTLL